MLVSPIQFAGPIRGAHPALSLFLAMALGAPFAGAQGVDPAVDDRDARIEQLERRIEQLERLLQVDGAAAPGPVASAPATTPSPPPNVPPGAAPPTAGRPAFEVDPDAAERALERTLVDTGNLLLPAGKIDVAPFTTYEYSESEAVIVVDNGDAFTELLRVRRDEVTAGFDVRFGLPFDSQLEARVPFVFARQRADGRAVTVGGVPVTGPAGEESAAGLGNLSVGLAKTLVREDGWVPDVIGRVRYDSATGPNMSNGVVIDDDFHELTGSFTLLKRQDPLAFSGSFSYTYAFEDATIRPGPLYSASLGAFLALSPETSLSLGVSAGFRGETRVGGTPIIGSEERPAIASFGVSSILAQNTLLNFNVGIGLTQDSPDFVITASVPIRFNTR
ncbi:MAG: transporter [Pseudomonadota bacterium]